MTGQTMTQDRTSAFELATAELRVGANDLRPLEEAAQAAGFQASTGTIAFAGQYASGSYSVQYNNQNGGFSSAWPQWAYEIARDALVANKRVWVASNGDPFGPNLAFVMILA